MHRPVHGVRILPSNGVGNDHVGTQRNTDEEIDHQTNDETVGSHRRHGDGAGGTAEVAHHRDIRSVEQLLQNRRCCHRQSKLRDLIPERAVQHIQFLFLNCLFQI